MDEKICCLVFVFHNEKTHSSDEVETLREELLMYPGSSLLVSCHFEFSLEGAPWILYRLLVVSIAREWAIKRGRERVRVCVAV